MSRGHYTRMLFLPGTPLLMLKNRCQPPVIPVRIQGETLRAYLDTCAGRNIISSKATKKMKLSPLRHEVRQIVAVNGMKKQSLSIYSVQIESMDGKQVETCEITGSTMHNFEETGHEQNVKEV